MNPHTQDCFIAKVNVIRSVFGQEALDKWLDKMDAVPEKVKMDLPKGRYVFAGKVRQLTEIMSKY